MYPLQKLFIIVTVLNQKSTFHNIIDLRVQFVQRVSKIPDKIFTLSIYMFHVTLENFLTAWSLM